MRTMSVMPLIVEEAANTRGSGRTDAASSTLADYVHPASMRGSRQVKVFFPFSAFCMER